MAAADVSALIDVASSPEPSSSPAAPVESVVEEPVLDAPAGDASEGGAEGADTGTDSADASQDADGQPQPKVDARTNPDAIRKALKAWRDSMPEGDAQRQIPRQLNDIVGREKAFRDVFPKVADAKQAKFILDSVGGGDGLTQLQATIKSVNETDALLYAGDGKVLKTLYEDMRTAGKPDAFGKLASPFLEQLAEVDPKAYSAALRPHVYQSLVQAEFPTVLQGLEDALSAVGADGKPAPNVEVLKGIVAEMKRWLGVEKNAVEGLKKSALDPDRQAFEREKSEFQTSQQKAFQNEVNGEWNRINNQRLGAALKPYLKMTFAKNWTDGTRKSVATEIINTALADVKADKSYKSQMDAFWSEPKPDKTKITKYHDYKMQLIADRIVKQVIEDRYPGYRSVGGPAPKPKPVGATAPAASAGGPAKPIYQTTMPKPDTVDWDKTTDTLFATGRFFDKRGILRTWNQRYK